MITRKNDLRDGTSYWESRKTQSLRVATEPAREFYDVVVIGAGISGALVATHLTGLALDVLVVDRRRPADGSTSASTALIQWEIDEPLTQLSKRVGARKAAACYRASYSAVRALKSMIRRHRYACDMSTRKTLLLAGSEMGERALQREAEARRRIGLPSRFLTAKALKANYGFEREAAIESRGSLEIDPRKLTLDCLRYAKSQGTGIVSPVAVTKLEATSAGVFLTLDTGAVVACRKAIVATGYETLPEISKQKYNLISTWALATVPQEREHLWHGEALVWEASDPYLYFRTTRDGRIIVGGEDASFLDARKRRALIARKSEIILRKLGKLLPEAKLKADFRWAGTFAESPTGLPVIGEVKELPNLFAILGAGGNGITFSMAAANIARDWVRGREHPDARLFAPES